MITLLPHQVEAVSKLKSGSILCGGVGTGKSITALAYYHINQCGGTMRSYIRPKPKDLYIITTAMKRDNYEWEVEAAHFLIAPDRALSKNNELLTVDSWNNIKKYEQITNAIFIFDEQRLVGSGAWVKTFYKIAKKNDWIILSATPGDVWMDFAPVFIANGFYRNKTEFARRHVRYSRYSKFPKIEGYMETKLLDKHRANVLVTMPYIRHTNPIYKDLKPVYDVELMKRVVKDRWNIYTDKPIKNAAELCYTMRKVSNSDISRLDLVKSIMQEHPRIIIFYNFDYELDILRTISDDNDIPICEWNGHYHEPIPDTDEWVYLVQYTAGAEGWNCVSTDTIIFYSLNYSYKSMKQASGRIDRLNTKFVDLLYYRLVSDAQIDKAILKAISSKRRFNASGFVPD